MRGSFLRDRFITNGAMTASKERLTDLLIRGVKTPNSKFNEWSFIPVDSPYRSL